MKALKILFADDDLKYSMLLKRFLEAEGYEVTYAGNGRIALEQFPAVQAYHLRRSYASWQRTP